MALIIAAEQISMTEFSSITGALVYRNEFENEHFLIVIINIVGVELVTNWILVNSVSEMINL